MGITGLLPLLKPIHHNTHISEFSGQRLAIDGYVWLHRGAYTCSVELVTGQPTHKYVDYFLHRVRLLRHHKITPYIVFDGGHLPAKQGTESERKKKREENLRQATTLANAGKHSDARDYYSKCVDITPQMAYQVIKALKAENVHYVVAPYEADAQMRYLEQEGLVDGIITEDSDLLVFGARCVLFKFDTSGQVMVIRREQFGSLHTKTASFVGWSDEHFREMAVLSGCDYLPSIQGVGIITAAKLMRKYKSVEKVLQFLRLEGNKKIPKEYLAEFRMAELAFKHQRVFDPRSEMLVYLTPPQDGDLDEKQEAYIGRELDPELAKAIAFGDRDPVTHEPMDDINHLYNPAANRSTLRLPLMETSRPNIDQDGKPKSEVKMRGIMSFFAPLSKSIGKASGKTSLTEVMQLDVDKRLQSQVVDLVSPVTSPFSTPKKTSRFFSTSALVSPLKKTSKRARDSHEPETPRHSKLKKQDDPAEEPNVVEQEDGYISPFSDKSWSSGAGMTSPPDQSPTRCKIPFDVDPISSPVHGSSNRPAFPFGKASFSAPSRATVTLPPVDAPRIVEIAEIVEAKEVVHLIPGPNLEDIFGDDSLTDMMEVSARQEVILVECSSPLRPQNTGSQEVGGESSPAPTQIPDSCDELDDEDLIEDKHRLISEGWRKAYAWNASLTASKSSPATPELTRVQNAARPLHRRYSAPVKATSRTPRPSKRATTSKTKTDSNRNMEPPSISRLAAFRFRG